MSHHLLKIVMEQLPAQELESLLNPNPLLCMAIKTQDQGYLYANQQHLKLMGFTQLHPFMHLYDSDLYSDPRLLKMYRDDDDAVYGEDKALKVKGEVAPDRHVKLIKTMEGIIYPLHIKSSKPDGVVLMMKPSNEMLSLTLNLLLNVSSEKLAASLTKKSYPVRYKQLPISLARMEILCFAELLKGKSASKTAETLGLKSLTVESYLTNLKNKCGVGTKNELIQFFIDHPLLEEILV